MNSLDAGFILIADDNPANLAILAQTLKGEGLAVRVAGDGESVLQQVIEEPPALILLDVMMPGIDGFETCRRLKANPVTHEIPVIFMTALTDADHKVMGLSLGAVDYITKPFDAAEVIARVKIQLQLQHLLQTLGRQNQQLKQEIDQRQRAEADLKHLNEDLERRVTSRTAELQAAQVKLVQQEKLSTLGELMAGVAHELRNPISSLVGNIAFIQSYTTQLLEHVTLYQQQLPEPGEVIVKHAHKIDLAFMGEDLPNLLRALQTSSDRVYDISDALRIFTRNDHKRSKISLHAGLDSTLLVLKHRLQSKDNQPEIKIHKAYGDLPNILCFAGQINQVFMNVLANAVDALEEKASVVQNNQAMKATDGKSPLRINITTEVEGSQAIVRIKDNGGGMPETVQCRVFEQAYTTKAVGKGTGFGLSITHQIVVENHGGQITCESVPGQGTEFIIKLPIRDDSATEQ